MGLIVSNIENEYRNHINSTEKKGGKIIKFNILKETEGGGNLNL